MKEVIPFNFEAQQIRVVKDEQAYSRLNSDEKATLVRQVVGSALQTRVLPPALDYFRKVYSSETKRAA